MSKFALSFTCLVLCLATGQRALADERVIENVSYSDVTGL